MKAPQAQNRFEPQKRYEYPSLCECNRDETIWNIARDILHNDITKFTLEYPTQNVSININYTPDPIGHYTHLLATYQLLKLNDRYSMQELYKSDFNCSINVNQNR